MSRGEIYKLRQVNPLPGSRLSSVVKLWLTSREQAITVRVFQKELNSRLHVLDKVWWLGHRRGGQVLYIKEGET